MPIRRFNYTGRKRIRLEDVAIAVYECGDGASRFDADPSLERYELPEDAQVFVEAYRQTTSMRFDFGTVGALQPPGDRTLTEFDSADGVLFRVRVVSMSGRRAILLASAERIRPKRPELKQEERIPLLPVKSSEDLGEQVFSLDFSDRPLLLVNARVGSFREVTRDPAFIALVLPATLRDILTRIVRVEKYSDGDDADDWRSQWLRFATLLPGVPDLPTDDDEDHLDSWIDEAVASFCRKSRILAHFQGYWDGEG